MAKKGFIILILAVFVAGGVFAQKHTVTVDVGPTIIGLGISAAFKALENSVDADVGIDSSGFGIGAQYELQPFEKLSFAARFAYLGFGFGFSETDDRGVTAKADIDMSSFSIEAHARYYPFTGTFFVDGMGGYGSLKTDLSGEIIVVERGNRYAESISESLSRGYVKLGAKLGWRFVFGSSGGFTFEPSVGYYYGIGLGDTLGSQLADAVSDATGNMIEDISGLDSAFGVFEDFLFIGGPRVSLAFGWRF